MRLPSLSQYVSGILLAILAAFFAVMLQGTGHAREDAGQGLSSLKQLQKGAWELRYRDGTPSQRICLKTGLEFIELKHRGTRCDGYSVENAGGRVTVQYQCHASGYGRTSVRIETPALVQVTGQGIVDGLPYQFSAEARRVGDCR